jgi:hypothetical protein
VQHGFRCGVAGVGFPGQLFGLGDLGFRHEEAGGAIEGGVVGINGTENRVKVSRVVQIS